MSSITLTRYLKDVRTGRRDFQLRNGNVASTKPMTNLKEAGESSGKNDYSGHTPTENTGKRSGLWQDWSREDSDSRRKIPQSPRNRIGFCEGCFKRLIVSEQELPNGDLILILPRCPCTMDSLQISKPSV